MGGIITDYYISRSSTPRTWIILGGILDHYALDVEELPIVHLEMVSILEVRLGISHRIDSCASQWEMRPINCQAVWIGMRALTCIAFHLFLSEL